jgi:hypothetical protein
MHKVADIAAGSANDAAGRRRPPQHGPHRRAPRRCGSPWSATAGGYHPGPRVARPFDVVLDEDATLVAELSQVPTTPVLVKVGTGAELAEWVQLLPEDVAAAFLTRVDPARARAAQDELELAGGRRALTDEDAAAIALACIPGVPAPNRP